MYLGEVDKWKRGKNRYPFFCVRLAKLKLGISRSSSDIICNCVTLPFGQKTLTWGKIHCSKSKWKEISYGFFAFWQLERGIDRRHPIGSYHNGFAFWSSRKRPQARNTFIQYYWYLLLFCLWVAFAMFDSLSMKSLCVITWMETMKTYENYQRCEPQRVM